MADAACAHGLDHPDVCRSCWIERLQDVQLKLEWKKRQAEALDRLCETAIEKLKVKEQELKRVRPVYEAAMAMYGDQAMHWRPTTDPAWDRLERACSEAIKHEGN